MFDYGVSISDIEHKKNSYFVIKENNYLIVIKFAILYTMLRGGSHEREKN